jgi:hypothetical protein
VKSVGRPSRGAARLTDHGHIAARAVLTRTWPGWNVRFAHDGMADMTHHLGLGRDLTRAQGRFEIFERIASWQELCQSIPQRGCEVRLPMPVAGRVLW